MLKILDSVYNLSSLAPDNERENDVYIKLQEDKLQMKEFKQLWERINRKSAYTVAFESDELVNKAVQAINLKLYVNRPIVNVQYGDMDKIDSKASLEAGTSFVMQSQHATADTIHTNDAVKYDLVGKIVEQVGLTRSCRTYHVQSS